MKLNILTVLIILFFCACDKKDEETKPRNELLTQKPWKLTASNIDPPVFVENADSAVTDLYIHLPACEKDNVYIFGKDSRYTLEEGDIKCGSFLVIESGTWILDEEGNIISLNANGEFQYDMKILELGNSKMKVEFSKPGEYADHVFTNTYSH
ncbi:MAG: lipocalin family protein [bacterium]